MSEYQYYEWQTIDRTLTPTEQRAVNQLSSHIEVGPSKAVVTYNWGNFKHNPKEVFLRYFDAHLYLSNWGSQRLMFRFPKGLLNEAELRPYLGGEYMTLQTSGEYQVLDIDTSSDGDEWDDADDSSWSLSDFVGLRAELLEGDYRLLYLLWLLEMAEAGDFSDDEDAEDDESEDWEGEFADEEGETDETADEDEMDDLEPPVPPGLKTLSPALENAAQFFGLDPYLIEAAAEASPDLRPTPEVDYRAAVALLSRSECDDFLARLAAGDARTGLFLRRRLAEFSPNTQPAAAPERRSVAALLQRADELREAEKRRQAEEARRKHVAEMNALAAREAQTWQEVERILISGTKSASTYDQATALLEKLSELAKFRNQILGFQIRVRQLAEKFSARPSLMDRWRKRGWIG